MCRLESGRFGTRSSLDRFVKQGFCIKLGHNYPSRTLDRLALANLKRDGIWGRIGAIGSGKNNEAGYWGRTHVKVGFSGGVNGLKTTRAQNLSLKGNRRVPGIFSTIWIANSLCRGMAVWPLVCRDGFFGNPAVQVERRHMLKSRFGEGVAILVAPLMVFGTVVLATIAPAVAQLDQAKSTELQKVQEGAAAQGAIDQLDDERSRLEGQYRVTIDQLENLRKYNTQLRGLITAQKAEMISVKEQIERITGIERDIVPLMFDMLITLGEFVELDVPFLIRERRERVRVLTDLMGRASATNAEKYRRILEAYQIENDYGRTIEAYEGNIMVNEEPQKVTFLKIGRVSFIYQTLDGSDSYVWNQKEKLWEHLSGSYDMPVTLAIRMAREQIPPDLIFIPVRGAVAAN